MAGADRAVGPLYRKDEGRGRSPIGLERMLRMYITQQCFGLSDTGIDDATYDSQAIRAKVEHPFHFVKNLFEHKKNRCRGLAKNTAQFFTLFALANLVIAKRQLFTLDAQGPF